MQSARITLLTTAGASVWVAALTLLAAPLMISIVGVEAYGLIGFYTSLQAIIPILDLGMATTLTRELARRSQDDAGTDRSVDLATSLETAYLVLALTLSALVFLAAPVIASNWVKARSISEADVTRALQLAAFALAFQLPNLLYNAGLNGLHRLVLASTILVPMTFARIAGSVAAVWLIAPTVGVFFSAQLVFTALQTIVTRQLFWRVMPKGRALSRFNWIRLRETIRFSAGVSGANITAIILTQADKLIASKVLALEQFGYYMLASTLAAGISFIVGPIATMTYPRLARLAVDPHNPDFVEVYHTATQLLGVMAVPVAAVLALFPREVLLAWTSNPDAVANSHSILALLACANGIGACMALLPALELAEGRTGPALLTHSISLVVLVPLVYWLVTQFGAVGAAVAWVCQTVGMLMFRPFITHKYLSLKDKQVWYTQDLGPVLLATVTAALVLKIAVPMPSDRIWLSISLGAIWLGLAGIACLSSWRVRSQVEVGIRRLQPFKNTG